MNKQTKTEDLLDEMEMIANVVDVQTCGLCGAVGHDMEFDEYANMFMCCKCDVEREIGGI